jgi:hypothetical protein
MAYRVILRYGDARQPLGDTDFDTFEQARDAGEEVFKQSPSLSGYTVTPTGDDALADRRPFEQYGHDRVFTPHTSVDPSQQRFGIGVTSGTGVNGAPIDQREPDEVESTEQ